MKTNKIGLFGYGFVGQGLWQILAEDPQKRFVISRICVRNPNKYPADVRSLMTTCPEEILDDPEIGLIVEVISDDEAAVRIAETALLQGKQVVTANKKMLARNLTRLLEIREEGRGTLMYEASCCAGIPIIRIMEDYYAGHQVTGISGIFNGSTNYILTSMHKSGEPYELILKRARDLGFAEENPISDVSGEDAGYKLSILAGHAFGEFRHPADILTFGIEYISSFDLEYAKKEGGRIKLVPMASCESDGLRMMVIPQLVRKDHSLYAVDNEFNGVVTESRFTEQQFYYGKGAGKYPTAAAVFSDMLAVSDGYQYRYPKRLNRDVPFSVSDIRMNYYIRTNLPIGRLTEGLPSVEVIEEYRKGSNLYSIIRVTDSQLRLLAPGLKKSRAFVMALPQND